MFDMRNVDVDIYMNQFINFFDNNPNDLIDLIGDCNKNEFYDKVREQCYKNIDNGEEISITRQQMIDIVVGLSGMEKTTVIAIDKLFEKTKYGYFGLN
jgi:hypothetical protein